MTPRRVNFVLHVYGTTDREGWEWAEGVAKFLQDELNEATGELPKDVTVEVEDCGEGD